VFLKSVFFLKCFFFIFSYTSIVSFFRPNPLQYFLVPDIEVENGDDDEDVEEEEEVSKLDRLP
jgi:hypothetical protein